MNLMRGVGRWSSCVLLLLGAVAACSPQPDGSTSTSAKPGRAVFDPPAKFDAKAGVPMPKAATAGLLLNAKGNDLGLLRNPVKLYKDMAYVATQENLLAIDTTKGAVTTITPQAKPESDPGNSVGFFTFTHPVVITEGASPLALASFVVKQPAAGTHAERVLVEFTAVNAASTAITLACG
ncbi:hypothetical protein ABT246_43290 [Streptomyces sp. NPDC001553]|uniref:hypothetical protein n=1 Tax=Streptomyces sp. NPDC001553 TaxID=3154385 RepID=UPI00332AC91C